MNTVFWKSLSLKLNIKYDIIRYVIAYCIFSVFRFHSYFIFYPYFQF